MKMKLASQNKTKPRLVSSHYIGFFFIATIKPSQSASQWILFILFSGQETTSVCCSKKKKPQEVSSSIKVKKLIVDGLILKSLL